MLSFWLMLFIIKLYSRKNVFKDMFLICHDTSRDLMFKGLCDYNKSGNPSS